MSTDRLTSRTKSPRRYATFGEPTFGPKLERVSDSTRRECGEVLDDEHKVKARRNELRLGQARCVVSAWFSAVSGDAALGPGSRTARSKSVTRAGGSLKSASPQVRIHASRAIGLVAVNAPTSESLGGFQKKRKQPPALSISNDMRCTARVSPCASRRRKRLRDAGAAEEAVVVEGDTFALSSKRGKRRLSSEDTLHSSSRAGGRPDTGHILRV